MVARRSSRRGRARPVASLPVLGALPADCRHTPVPFYPKCPAIKRPAFRYPETIRLFCSVSTADVIDLGRYPPLEFRFSGSPIGAGVASGPAQPVLSRYPSAPQRSWTISAPRGADSVQDLPHRPQSPHKFVPKRALGRHRSRHRVRFVQKLIAVGTPLPTARRTTQRDPPPPPADNIATSPRTGDKQDPRRAHCGPSRRRSTTAKLEPPTKEPAEGRNASKISRRRGHYRTRRIIRCPESLTGMPICRHLSGT